MKKLLTAILLTTVLSSFGQSSKLNCVCAESQITSKSEPDTIFYLQNGTPISLCGYKVKDTNPPVYLKFVLAFCLPDTLLDIDIWNSNQSCAIRVSGDTLLVDELESKTTEKIHLQGLEIIRKTIKTVKPKPLTPIQTVDRIFKDYIKYSESTDSQDDKDAMTKALQTLQQSNSETDLKILINVWMYYDPTDFPTRKLIEPIFNKNKSATLIALDNRIKQKRKWEKKESAPYSELFTLQEQLSKH